MSNVDAMFQNILELFSQKGEDNGMTQEEIACLLGDINFMQMYQSARARSRMVCKYEISSIIPDELEYRSQPLFNGPACKLYEERDWAAAARDVFDMEHAIELWLLDDMRLVSVSCCAVYMDEGDYTAVYREIKCEGWPFGEAPIDLHELTNQMNRLVSLRENETGISWHES